MSVAEQQAQLPDALVIRAIAAPDRQGLAAEPGNVAALDPAIAGDAAEHWDIEPSQQCSDCRRLGAALRLAHLAEDDALVRRDRRIARIRRVHGDRGVTRQERHVRAE